jgi:hypothetical protein
MFATHFFVVFIGLLFAIVAATNSSALCSVVSLERNYTNIATKNNSRSLISFDAEISSISCREIGVETRIALRETGGIVIPTPVTVVVEDDIKVVCPDACKKRKRNKMQKQKKFCNVMREGYRCVFSAKVGVCGVSHIVPSGLSVEGPLSVPLDKLSTSPGPAQSCHTAGDGPTTQGSTGGGGRKGRGGKKDRVDTRVVSLDENPMICTENQNVSFVQKMECACRHFCNFIESQYNVRTRWDDLPVEYMNVGNLERFATYISKDNMNLKLSTATGYLSSMRTAFSQKNVTVDDSKWTRIRKALKKKYKAAEVEPRRAGEVDEEGQPAANPSETKKANKYTLGQFNDFNKNLFQVC